jgi:hypothetical protein
MLPFLQQTGGSSTEGREKSTGSLRVAETVEETLDRLAAEWVIAMATIGALVGRVEAPAADAF